MKYRIIIVVCIAIIVIGYVVLRFVDNPKQINKTTSEAQVQNTLATQTSEGMVTVEVMPKTLSPGEKVQFDVKFTTHSGDVNYDLVKIASLTDDAGGKYKAISWDGSMGGHHVEGILTFPQVTKQVKSITLIIPDVDNQDRIFNWNLK